MNMAVERSTLQQVLDRIELCRQKRDDARKAKSTKRDFDYDKHISALQEEEDAKKVGRCSHLS